MAAIAGARLRTGQAPRPGNVARRIDTVFARFGRDDDVRRFLPEPAAGSTPRPIRIRGPGLGRHTPEAIPPLTRARGALPRYAGQCASAELGVGYRIAVESDELALPAPHLPVDRLRPTIRDELESPALAITCTSPAAPAGR